MCRVLGAVAREPVSLRHELLEAENPMIRQSEVHDSGWGMAVYDRAQAAPRVVRFPEAAFSDEGFLAATELRGRIFNVHVRRATLGGLKLANTHPFCDGPYSFCHNGTVLAFSNLRAPGVRAAAGDTDSEHVFNLLLASLDPDDIPASLRRTFTEVVRRSPFSGLNCLFSDGRRLFAYNLGQFELHWLQRPGQLLVASEKLTAEDWRPVEQDMLLTLDPADPSGPSSERLLGDAVVASADIRPEIASHLRGEERDAFATERAARLADAPLT